MDGVKGFTPQKALIGSAILIFAAILVVTGIRLLSRGQTQPEVSESPQESPRAGTELFGDLGSFRIKAADGTMLALAIDLEYEASQRALKEELLLKKESFRTKVEGYFAAKKKADLDPIGLDAMKASLLDLFNAELITGKVKAVVISDYGLIE